MTTIAIKKYIGGSFETDSYEIDLSRPFGGYEAGDLICFVQPFHGFPVTLEIAIRKNGNLIFRSWSFSGEGNTYLHTYAQAEENHWNTFAATEEQIDTVNGLFSGRIKFEGLKLTPGATLQKVCPIDVCCEEKRTGLKIYLA